MPKLVIKGGRKLSGELLVQGSKNGVLPILAATLLCKGESILKNCPDISDVSAAVRILNHLGCQTSRCGNVVTVLAGNSDVSEIPDELMREMRSSVVFLGAIIAKTGHARISLPGGCELGPRPIDLHVKALKQLGVEINEDHGYLDCRCENGLYGADITLSFPSVGATENIILAAVTANGTTTVTNAAREPEIVDLARFLNGCGADIRGAGESTLQINGVSQLVGGVHSVLPDRIAAATYMTYAAVTGGELRLKGICERDLSTVVGVFRESGMTININRDNIYIKADHRPKAIKTVRTMTYPGFPTDVQAQIMAMSCIAKGTSIFVESIFESRYKHVPELCRMGADISVEGRVAIVEGVDRLHSATVKCTDLRGGAALVAAGLAAEGYTEIDDIFHIDRGYECIERALSSIGADIIRIM